MHRILSLSLAVALGVAMALPADDAAPNTLSAKEKAEGWTLLFDGKDLNGWESRQGGEWKVVGGAIMTDSPKGGGLYTTQEFGDFILRAEFRTTNDVNGGIYLRYNRAPAPPAQGDAKAKKAAVPRGYELQIRDSRKGGYTTGSLVDAIQADPGAKIVSNQWNRFEVTAQGDHFVVMYNGRKILDGHDAKFARGSIGLQWAHPERVPGRKIEFRNLKIKSL